MPDTKKPTVLLVHNYYQQPGGEDRVFEAEAALLASRGHEVVRFTAHNDAVRDMGALELAGATVFNPVMHEQLRALIRERKPAVLHAHNLFPLISPAAYAAARDEGVPVVQTLHNFRLLCAGATLFRDGAPCEACLQHRSMWPAVLHRCYRDSLPATAVTVRMLRHHHRRGTWATDVDRYLVMSEFARRKFIAGGLPAARITVKPNFMPDPRPGGGARSVAPDAPVLFVGRLSAEKGVTTLLSAWAQDATLPRLVLVGDGPLRDAVAAAAAHDPRIAWRGALDAAAVREAYDNTTLLVFPSECYEGFPMVLVEAFALGVPVVSAAVQGAAPIVADGVTGITFTAGDAARLAATVHRLYGDASLRARVSASARAEYEARLTPDAAYMQLRAAYDAVIGGRRVSDR